MVVCPLVTMRPTPPPYMCRPYRPHNAKGTIVRPLAKCYETSRFYPVPFRLLYTMVGPGPPLWPLYNAFFLSPNLCRQ